MRIYEIHTNATTHEVQAVAQHLRVRSGFTIHLYGGYRVLFTTSVQVRDDMCHVLRARGRNAQVGIILTAAR